MGLDLSRSPRATWVWAVDEDQAKDLRAALARGRLPDARVRALRSLEPIEVAQPAPEAVGKVASARRHSCGISPSLWVGRRGSRRIMVGKAADPGSPAFRVGRGSQLLPSLILGSRGAGQLIGLAHLWPMAAPTIGLRSRVRATRGRNPTSTPSAPTARPRATRTSLVAVMRSTERGTSPCTQ